MSKRHEDLHYLTALGHTALEGREGREPDTCYRLVDFDIDTVEIGVDLFAVRAALGEKRPEDWFDFYCDEEAFTGGIPVAVKALMLGHMYALCVPRGWATCLDCDDGCEKCNLLAVVPTDMVVTCPACGGEGSTPRDGTCAYCKGDGLVWSADEDDVRADAQGWDDVEATNRSLMGEI